MQITQNQIKALIDEKGNARKCNYVGRTEDSHYYWRVTCIDGKLIDKNAISHGDCQKCLGSGKVIISIPKEWVECPNCEGKSYPLFADVISIVNCGLCFGKGKIQKYEVGDEIVINPFTSVVVPVDFVEAEGEIWKLIKLKIISETENEWKVCLV